jgi:HSP20 family protein
MLNKQLMAPAVTRDPFAMLRRMTSEFDRLFEGTGWPSPKWSLFRSRPAHETLNWVPEIDVFVRDNRLVTKVDLPGMKKEDVKVEVTDGYLTISGERKTEAEDKKDEYYRCEREYGSFYRAVPMPEGVKLDDVKASFADGVLEVSLPLPAAAPPAKRQIQIEDLPKARSAA